MHSTKRLVEVVELENLADDRLQRARIEPAHQLLHDLAIEFRLSFLDLHGVDAHKYPALQKRQVELQGRDLT